MSDPNNNPHDSLARISAHVYAPTGTYGGQQSYTSQSSVGMSQHQEDIPRGAVQSNVKGTSTKPQPDLPKGQLKPNVKGTTRPPPAQPRGIHAPPQGGYYPQATGVPPNPMYPNHHQQPANVYPDPSTQFPAIGNYSYGPSPPNPYGGHPGQVYFQGQSPPPGAPPGGFFMPPQGAMYPPAAGPPYGAQYPPAAGPPYGAQYPPATGHPQGGYPGPYAPPMDSPTRSDGSYTSGVGGFVAPRNP